MNYELILTLTGIMLFAYWFTFIMGSPLADPDKVNPREILFGIPLWMATRRLKMAKVWADSRASQLEELSMTKDPGTKKGLEKDHRLAILLAGREFFTWEKSILCPICLHWWVTVIVGIALLITDTFNARADFFLAAFVYLANHFIIRKIA